MHFHFQQLSKRTTTHLCILSSYTFLSTRPLMQVLAASRLISVDFPTLVVSLLSRLSREPSEEIGTSWLPHHWQLLQTGPETSNFDKNKKVRHVVCIEFREEFISGFDNRQFWVLAIFVIWYSTRTKNFSTKTQLFFLSNPDSKSTRKTAQH